jgi:lipid-binding SYLF domain-containing protein
MKSVALFSYVAALVASSSLLAQEVTADKRLQNAAEAFREVMATPDKGIPRDLMDRAQCVIIVPGLLKGAFGVGGEYGRGFASCRRCGHDWSAPAAVAIEGGSFGFQLGGSSTDLFMLVMKRSGMNRLLGDKFTLGGQAEAAAGPVGRETSANTDILMTAEMLSWSRSRGLFAGVSLQGTTLRPDGKENRKLYGRDVTNKEILESAVPAPRAAHPLMAVLDHYPGGTLAAGCVSLGENELHFATGKFDIPPGGGRVLGDIAAQMKAHRDWIVEVDGYTDNVGDKAANEKLSEERANSVVNWLVEHGVDRSRLTAKGYGESRPMASNSTPEGRAKNRRVELVRQ